MLISLLNHEYVHQNYLEKNDTPTCGHKTFGVKPLFKHSTTHQSFATVDTNAARSPKRFIPQNR